MLQAGRHDNSLYPSDADTDKGNKVSEESLCSGKKRVLGMRFTLNTVISEAVQRQCPLNTDPKGWLTWGAVGDHQSGGFHPKHEAPRPLRTCGDLIPTVKVFCSAEA